jgi:penicillin-binding protein 1A
MGKTGTTSNFKDALFVGSTFGRDGITIAIRIGFDDDRSLGAKETGARVALPVFKEIMLRIYKDRLIGPAPKFPADMEDRISAYLKAIAEPTTPEAVLPPSPTASLTGSHDEQTWWRPTGADHKLTR